jgi:hypothetical protein
MKKSLLPLLLASLLLPSVAIGGGHLSKLEQFNVMVIVSTGELGFDKWLQAYEGGAEMRKKDGRDFIVGKIDDKTAVVTGNVFDKEKWVKKFRNVMKATEEATGMRHIIYFAEPAK